MKVTIAHTTEQKYSDNTENVLKLINEMTGGSSTAYETPGTPPTDVAVNDFTIKEVEKFDPVLDSTNTLSIDIMTILKTPFADISFIDVFCFTTTDTEIPVPVRFKVTLNDGTNTMILGEMAHFSITNVKGNLVQGITISDVTVLTDDVAQLVVTVGSLNKNV